MQTEWNYTNLADAYLERPAYADAAISAMCSIAGLMNGHTVCDVGAGVAHLTIPLANRGLNVVAIEPNDAMRRNGMQRTDYLSQVIWHEGTGESTGQSDQAFDMVTFGSSFNVCDRASALIETARILKPKGWFACMWNHRDLSDPIQNNIEEIIKKSVPSYNYGTRREDQTEVINSSGLFGSVINVSANVIHTQKINACIEAWKSHATLERNAGSSFYQIVTDIEKYLNALGVEEITIPYTTNIWICQLH